MKCKVKNPSSLSLVVHKNQAAAGLAPLRTSAAAQRVSALRKALKGSSASSRGRRGAARPERPTRRREVIACSNFWQGTPMVHPSNCHIHNSRTDMIPMIQVTMPFWVPSCKAQITRNLSGAQPLDDATVFRVQGHAKSRMASLNMIIEALGAEERCTAVSTVVPKQEDKVLSPYHVVLVTHESLPTNGGGIS